LFAAINGWTPTNFRSDTQEIFVFQKWYTGNILGIGRNKFLKSYFSRKLPEIWRGDGVGPHTRAARPRPWSRPLHVRPPRSTSDDAPSPIKTPRRKTPKYPINFPEHIAIRCRHRPRRLGGSRSSSRHPAEEENCHRRSSSSPCFPPERWVSSLPWTMDP
jgi:hypothetical protein